MDFFFLLLYGLIHIQHTYCVYQNMKLFIYKSSTSQFGPPKSLLSLSLSLLLLKLLKVGGETEDESRSCRVCGDGRHVSPCLWKKILPCQILSVEDFTLFAERF